jgi:putative transposase
VIDVVMPYTLTLYPKDAFKNAVPKLRDTYNASELADGHPVHEPRLPDRSL